MTHPASIPDLLAEYERALDYTDRLWRDLTDDEVRWRPHEDFSPIGWHLGHQPSVAHFMVRNLTAAEPSPDPELDSLMDSSTPESARGDLPSIERLGTFREAVADRVRFRIGSIASGDVGAPDQLQMVARTLLTALVNHEYQHSQWISEVRSRDLGHGSVDRPSSPLLGHVDGYLVLV